MTDLTIPSSPGTLFVDRHGRASRDCVRTLEDAVARLIGDEYDTIVLYTATSHDDVGLVEYLEATWPDLLRTLTVRRVSAGGVVDVWDPRLGHFVRERTRRRSARRSSAAQGEGEMQFGAPSAFSLSAEGEDRGDRIEERDRIDRLAGRREDVGRTVIPGVSSAMNVQQDARRPGLMPQRAADGTFHIGEQKDAVQE
jgi:hypothetical protein